MFFLDPIIKLLTKILQQLVLNGQKEDLTNAKLDEIIKLLTSPPPAAASFKMSVIKLLP